MQKNQKETQKSEKKYLVYTIKSESYGIEIGYVKEIIGMMSITAIPKVKKHIRGIINLRGKIIPVIDVRARLELEETEYDDRTCIVIIEIEGEKAKKHIGVIVDRVSGVMEIRRDNIVPMQYDEMHIKDLS